jgi:protein gp37
MAKDSSIEWTHHTFNPWWGCTKVSPGCKQCYAEAFSRRLGKDIWGARAERQFFSDEHWQQPIKWNAEAHKARVRRRVFCASMADVFEKRADLTPLRERLWRLIRDTPSLDWLLLTKRPEHVKELVPWGDAWPANIWAGVTCENQRWANKRIPLLIKLPTVVRFLSCEPLLGPLDLRTWIKDDGQIHWVITGGESGHKARPMNPDWARSLRDQCNERGVPFHFKQWGHWGPPSTPTRRIATIEFRDSKGAPIRLAKLGKHASGRILDGATWDGFPTPAK